VNAQTAERARVEVAEWQVRGVERRDGDQRLADRRREAGNQQARCRPEKEGRKSAGSRRNAGGDWELSIFASLHEEKRSRSQVKRCPQFDLFSCRR
jgi:hypothetical protein